MAQIAIAWVAAQGADIVPLIGARRRDQLDEALGALDVKLGPDDLAAIEQAVPRGRRRASATILKAWRRWIASGDERAGSSSLRPRVRDQPFARKGGRRDRRTLASDADFRNTSICSITYLLGSGRAQ